MENTPRIFFDDDRARWFIAQGESWVGPLKASEVYEKLKKGEVTLAHFIWCKGQSGWKRMMEVEPFNQFIPDEPSRSVKAEVKEEVEKKTDKKNEKKNSSPPSPPGEGQVNEDDINEPKEWFLFYNETQFGPFSATEIRRFLGVGKIHGRVYAWKDGLGDWVRLEEIEEFEQDVLAALEAWKRRKSAAKKVPPAAPPKKEKTKTVTKNAGKGTQKQSDKEAVYEIPADPEVDLSPLAAARNEMRASPRKPLVARLVMTEGRGVITGLCRDISVGGMQVLTDRIPGPVGARLKINISPPQASRHGLKPFVAEGIVVRILEDQRGFSFRFEKLNDLAKKSIETYIAAVESPA